MMAGFLPLVVFALLASLSQDLALWAAFAAAFAVLLRDFAPTRALRLLDSGSVTIFGATALFAGFVRPGLTVEMTRLIVDSGFLLLALLALVLRHPLTRETAKREGWPMRPSRLAHYGLTVLWAAGFAVMAAADALANLRKDLPALLDGAVALTVLLVALAITARVTAPRRQVRMPVRAVPLRASGKDRAPSAIREAEYPV